MWHPDPFVKHPIPATRPPSAEAAARSRWFSPLRVGRLDLTERTWVPAMVPWRATEDGHVTPAVLQWYERFARGQPGALVVEATGIRDIPSGPLLRIGHDRFLPGLTELVDTRSAGRARVAPDSSSRSSTSSGSGGVRTRGGSSGTSWSSPTATALCCRAPTIRFARRWPDFRRRSGPVCSMAGSSRACATASGSG